MCLSSCVKGHDWCIVQLGVPGIIHGFDVDTSFFTGNYAPYASIQAACLGRYLWPQPLRTKSIRLPPLYLIYVTYKSDQMPSFTLEGDRTGMAASPSQFEAVAKV